MMTRRLSRAAHRRHSEEPNVNLTPLIDVVFVILIMFILVAPLLELDNVELADAGHSSESAVTVQESSPIAIHVYKNNTISFNGNKVSIEQLPMLLQQAKKRYPHVKPQLYHDRRAYFGVYQSIKNALESAGFQQVDIVLMPHG